VGLGGTLAWIASSTVALATACGAAPADQQRPDVDWERDRREMVREQIRARGITSPRVLDAMTKVPRHVFVPEPQRRDAYGDYPLPIGYGQTISQPFIVGFMTDALEIEPSHRVLEIGTGSGYQAAILGVLAREVYTIEIVEALAERARGTLSSLGHANVHVRAGDGYRGWPEHAPYDRVMVTAAPPEVPQALVDQLRVGGLMAVPVGTGVQELRILRKTGSGLEVLDRLDVRFVPMIKKDQ
jgi:protein-L-isoaspartate(D-aspartate) O-methyltransferase